MALTIITDDLCAEYASPGHPERPARVTATTALLKSQSELQLEWVSPPLAGDEAILRAHTQEHLERLALPFDFDADTAAHTGIETHARRSAGGALLALSLAREGKTAFSLLRPPGHHATSDRAMGFCYLNSIAIAALEAQAAGFKRVAVFDFDVHHGNGTEEILLDKQGVGFYSIHQFPCYPGSGKTNRGANCFNYPVRPQTPRMEYRAILEKALKDLKAFAPDIIGVSAGFDAYRDDPLADGTLEAEDFRWLGESIRGFGIPAFSILEGGYSDDLPELVFAYLKGLDPK